MAIQAVIIFLITQILFITIRDLFFFPVRLDLFSPSPEDMLIDFRDGGGRERERERNIDVGEKHRSVACHMHSDQGPNMQPRHVP